MSVEYDLYLKKHKEGVRKAAEWLREHLPEYFEQAKNVEWLTNFNHDYSKTQPDEYEAYDRYFYGNNRSYQVQQDFNMAWLLHIHRNPHHWQYWVLLEDDNKNGPIALDMPMEYILEMICDWWSFSWSKGELQEIFKWYADHRYIIIFSEKTRKTVEEILKKMSQILQPL